MSINIIKGVHLF